MLQKPGLRDDIIRSLAEDAEVVKNLEGDEFDPDLSLNDLI
jgi:hypothetical protein